MSRDPRVFETIQRQTYEQNEDRILVLKAALKGLSCLMSGDLWVYGLSKAENRMVREELINSLVKNHLDNTTDEQIKGALDEIEVELERNNEE